MNSSITRNGLWSSLLLLGLFVIPLLFLGVPDLDDFMSSEVVGYTFILISLVFVYIGMKQYREESGGNLSYWKAVKIGLLITIFPAITFALYNIGYMEVIDPEFISKYTEYTIAEQSVGKSAEEVIAIRQSVTEDMETFDNPLIQFVVMFFSVFFMGVIVSMISAYFTKKTSVA